MKKLFAAILALCVALSLCACALDMDSLGGLGLPKQTEGKEDKPAQSVDADEPEEETKEETEPAKQEVTMSDDWKDFTFELDGEVYQLPCAYECFVDNGWKLDEEYSRMEENQKMNGYSREYGYLTNGAVRIQVDFINMSGNLRKVEDCNIGGITVEASDNIGLKLAKDITCSSTKEEVEKAYGTPSSFNSYTDYSGIRYEIDTYVEMSFYIYTSDTTNNEITLQNFVAMESDKTVPSDKRPEYLDDYVAPEELSENVTSTQFELDGILYQLPCPVDEFTKNGWTISSDSIGSLGAGNYSSGMYMTKGDAKIGLMLINLAEIEVTSVNCAVYGVEFDYYNLDEMDDDYIKYAGGLQLGSDLKAVEAACDGEGFEKYEGSSSVSYTKTSDDYDVRVRFYWDSDDKELSVTYENKIWSY